MIEHYEKIVIENIETPFSDGGKEVKLSSKDDSYFPTHENDNVYIKENMLETIFTEANEYLRKGASSYSYNILNPTESIYPVRDSEGMHREFRTTSLSAGRLKLGYGSDTVMKELRRRCRELISNASIHDILKKYESLTHQLDDNDNARNFRQYIDDLWQNINENHELLKGKCKGCPKKRLEF